MVDSALMVTITIIIAVQVDCSKAMGNATASPVQVMA